MALNFSRILCQRAINSKLARFPQTSSSSSIRPKTEWGSTTMSLVRPITMKIVQPQDESKITYEEKNLALKREMSPHLAIYKIQLTSTLSITHRFTGCILAGYASALGFGALVLPHDFSTYITMMEGLHLSSPTLIALKFMLAFPLAFHTCNGVRHLSWDMGKFLKLGEVYKTGYAMLGASFALSVFLAVL